MHGGRNTNRMRNSPVLREEVERASPPLFAESPCQNDRLQSQCRRCPRAYIFRILIDPFDDDNSSDGPPAPMVPSR